VTSLALHVLVGCAASDVVAFSNGGVVARELAIHTAACARDMFGT
jgi:hypothetical protein